MNDEMSYLEGGGTRRCMPLVSLHRVSVFLDRLGDPESDSGAHFTFQRGYKRLMLKARPDGEETREKVRCARAVGASEKILYKTDTINYIR